MIKLRSEESSKAFPNLKKAKKFLDWKPKENFKKSL